MGGVGIRLYAKERLRSDKLGEHTGWEGDNWGSVEDPSGAPQELVLLLKGHLVHYGNIREWVVGVKEVNMHVVRKDDEDTLMKWSWLSQKSSRCKLWYEIRLPRNKYPQSLHQYIYKLSEGSLTWHVPECLQCSARYLLHARCLENICRCYESMVRKRMRHSRSVLHYSCHSVNVQSFFKKNNPRGTQTNE